MRTSWTVLIVLLLFWPTMKSVKLSKRSSIKIFNVKLSLVMKRHQNMLLNGHVTTFVLLDKMLRRSPSSHRWTKMRLSICSTGVKNSCHKSTEKLKVHNYFGKRGMLVLVGAFVWKDSMPSLATTMTTITTFSPTTFSTESYILAFTSAVQIRLDSLSAGEINTKQLKADRPYILKLHKRTDNAEKFSSHSMAEVQKVVCEQVSLFLWINYLLLCSTRQPVMELIINSWLRRSSKRER